jgi:hypothetical protein
VNFINDTQFSGWISGPEIRLPSLIYTKRIPSMDVRDSNDRMATVESELDDVEDRVDVARL